MTAEIKQELTTMQKTKVILRVNKDSAGQRN